jgi:Flp pilus assembly protein TadG
MMQLRRPRRHMLPRRFIADRRGVVAILFALALPPLLLATGAAVDFARVGMLKTTMQSVADGAALAGASALCYSNGQTDATQAAKDYYTKGTAPVSRYATVAAPTVTIPSSIEVTVTATATLSNTLMRMVGLSETVSVTASAEGPAYQIQATKTGGFSASAYDSNSIYMYTVAPDGSVPTSVSSMTLLFTNDPAIDPNYAVDNQATKNVSVGANDYIGFALVNKTGGIIGYGSNQYGGTQGSTHIFYSSLPVPSMNAYKSQGTFYTGQLQRTYNWWGGSQTSCNTSPITGVNSTYVPTAQTNCYPHPCTEMNGTTVLNNNLLVGGSCSTQSAATQTCLQLQNNPVSFSWNDMGGGGDDFDYNDADYTVSCTPTVAGGVQPNHVVLVN